MISWKKSTVLILCLVAIGCYECDLPKEYQEYIDKSLAYFSTGITPTMITRAKRIGYTFNFVVRNKIMTKTGVGHKKPYSDFFMSLAPHLPDMDFSVNIWD